MSVIEIDTSGVEKTKGNGEGGNNLRLNLLEIVSPGIGSALNAKVSEKEPASANEGSEAEKNSDLAEGSTAVEATKPADTSKPTDATKPTDASNSADLSKRVEESKPADITAADLQKTEAALYPELILTRQALDALADRSDPKKAWENANAFFHLAGVQVERYIEYQGGISKIFHNVNQLAEELYKGIDEFKQGKRGFDLPEFAGKQLEEERLRELVKDFDKKDMLASIRGEKGQDLRTAFFNVFNIEEKEMLSEVDLALNKVELLSSIKLQQALAANKYAVENKDLTARVLAENVLKSIAATDPDTFKSSLEIQGLLLQSERGEAMDLTEGKASATALAEEAKKTIITKVSSVDALFNPDARKQAAEEALGFLVAALAANETVARRIWATWSESDKFQGLFSAAEAALAAQKKPPTR